MKKGKFYAVAVVVILLILIQPKVWHGLTDYFTQTNLKTQLGIAKTENGKSITQLLELDLADKKVVTITPQATFSKKELGNVSKAWIKFNGTTATGKLREVDLVVTKDSIEKREKNLLKIEPLGWHSDEKNLVKLPLVDPELIEYKVNKHNIFTGTLQLQNELNKIFSQVKNSITISGQPVRVRIIPVYKVFSQIPSGLVIEAKGINENNINFNVYVINQQAGFKLNYLTGELIRKGEE